eukprot:COSAG01_NODE_1452_length_10260_cov_26.827970_20_plen_97_part_00
MYLSRLGVAVATRIVRRRGGYASPATTPMHIRSSRVGAMATPPEVELPADDWPLLPCSTWCKEVRQSSVTMQRGRRRARSPAGALLSVERGGCVVS